MRHKGHRDAPDIGGRRYDRRAGVIKDASEMQAPIRLKVLVVDDKREFREENSKLVEGFGYSPVTAACGADALELYREKKDMISFVILDYNMPGLNGLQVLERLKEIDPEVIVIICSKGLNPKRIMDVMDAGATAFMPKPVMQSELRSLLASLMSALPVRSDG